MKYRAKEPGCIIKQYGKNGSWGKKETENYLKRTYPKIIGK